MQCSICYDNLCIKKSTKTSCGHYFHTSCLNKWLSMNNDIPSCPLCRETIIPRSTRSNRPIMKNILFQEIDIMQKMLDDLKNEEPIKTEKKLFLRLSALLKKFPYVLIDNKELTDIIYKQSKTYNDKHMEILCQSIST